MKVGLTDEHLERLEAGETITFESASLGLPGHNGVLEVEQTDAGNSVEYLNWTDLPDSGGE